MERFDTSRLDKIAFKAINQNGSGEDIDRYIYTHVDEGLGSLSGRWLQQLFQVLRRL